MPAEAEAQLRPAVAPAVDVSISSAFSLFPPSTDALFAPDTVAAAAVAVGEAAPMVVDANDSADGTHRPEESTHAALPLVLPIL